MNSSLARNFFLAATVVGVALPASAQVRMFEPPPTLVPQSPEATARINTLMLGAKPSPSEGCEQATVEVHGRIVRVTLKEMYADSTIFNPSRDDPWPGHMDPLYLRSYGGCKEGPLIAVNPGIRCAST